MCNHLFGKKRIMTADNFFSRKDLLLHCIKNDTNYIGTVKSTSDLYDKQLFENPTKRSRLFFSKYFKYVQFKNKKNSKDVVVVTTIDKPISLVENKKGKPTLVLEYNKTKGGVDLIDKMLESKTCSRPTRRWPMAVFYRLISIAAHNASIIFQKVNPLSTYDTFIEKLCIQLCKPYCEERFAKKNMTRREYACLFRCGMNLEGRLEKTGKCFICEEKRLEKQIETDQKQKRISTTTRTCASCKDSICRSHSKEVCDYCFDFN